MKKSLLDMLVCPACLPAEFPLELEVDTAAETGDEIVAGILACPHCGGIYPIRDGIAFLVPDRGGEPHAASRYETPPLLSSYLWSHYADLLGDPEASAAYVDWAALMRPAGGLCLDIGAAVGRFTFEMSRKSDFVIGLDTSVSFIRAARHLMRARRIQIRLPQEGQLASDVLLELPAEWDSSKVEFIVADAQALPFRAGTFGGLASLNLVDKVPVPLQHLREMNRVARRSPAQFLCSDPFSWSKEVAKQEDWLGGTSEGPYAGRGVDNIMALLGGQAAQLLPAWAIERQGHVWWKIRTHANHFELIRSCFVKASR